MASDIIAAVDKLVKEQKPTGPKTTVSQRNHQSPYPQGEHKLPTQTLRQWFPQADNYFHEYAVSCPIEEGERSGEKPAATIITRYNLSVILRTKCKEESEDYEAAFNEALGASWKPLDEGGYISGLGDVMTDAESVQALDFSTDQGAEEADKAVAYIKEEWMTTRKKYC
ncbi:hypothetical protein ACJ72_03384 [Emergomyces africanus]|uniref:Uncharacterized protein n=1 Tax=Emergomyces africanus TaxID=1955775 RepID=A0A1B7NZQ9_9EURO|nr:hypothetical protein ACJ72_03384 [Emergomyces africanus]